MSTDAYIIDCGTDDGDLSIDSIPMRNAPAWCVPDLSELWDSPPLRGTENWISQGRTGRIALPVVEDQFTLSLPLVVAGGFNRLGVANANLFTGLQGNLDYLDTNVWQLPGTANKTRTALFTKPDGTQFTGAVHVGPAKHSIQWPIANVVFRLTIIAGRLTVVP